MKGYFYSLLGLLIGPLFVVSFQFGFLPSAIRQIIPGFLVPALLTFFLMVSLYLIALVIRDYKMQLLGGVLFALIAYALIIGTFPALFSVLAIASYPKQVSLAWLTLLVVNVPTILFLRFYYKKQHKTEDQIQ